MGGPAIVNAPTGMAHIDSLIEPGAWYKNTRIIKLNLWILLLLITSSTNGYDGSMVNGLQTLDQWNEAFNHPTGSMLGLLSCIQQVGSFSGTPLSPYMIDIFGRKVPILFGAALMIVGTIVQTTAQSVGAFIGARFCIGFGLTFAGNCAPMLISEIAYPSQRAPLTGTYNALWYSGAIVAAWTTYGSFRIPSSWSWRLPSLLQGIPSILQIFLVWFMPESPRWLIGKGRDAEALKTLAYYHARGNDQDPLVQFEYNEIREAINQEREINATTGWADLFKTPGNRRRVRIIVAIGFFSQWSGNGLVSYYLNKVFDTIGITDVATQNLINGILQIWNMILAVGGGLFCERVGRRTLFLWSNVGMLLFFSLQTVCSARFAITQNPAAAHAVIAFIFLYYAAYDIAYSPLIASYTVEIMPFNLRAKGYAVLTFSVSLSLIFNQYANPIALQALGWKYYLVYCVFLAFELVFIYFFMVETKGRTLEETAMIFDGVEKIDELTARTQADLAQNTGRKGDRTPSIDEKVEIEQKE